MLDPPRVTNHDPARPSHRIHTPYTTTHTHDARRIQKINPRTRHPCYTLISHTHVPQTPYIGYPYIHKTHVDVETHGSPCASHTVRVCAYSTKGAWISRDTGRSDTLARARFRCWFSRAIRARVARRSHAPRARARRALRRVRHRPKRVLYISRDCRARRRVHGACDGDVCLRHCARRRREGASSDAFAVASGRARARTRSVCSESRALIGVDSVLTVWHGCVREREWCRG